MFSKHKVIQFSVLFNQEQLLVTFLNEGFWSWLGTSIHTLLVQKLLIHL